MTNSSDNKVSNDGGVLRVFQSRDETRAFYNKISKVYDLLAEHSEEPIKRAGLDKLDARPRERILEIGFGTGHSVVEIARRIAPGGKVFGIDLSEGMLDISKERLVREGLADCAELALGDAMKLPYEDGSMDGVFMSFTLELFDTPEIPVVLRECRRVLRPDGRIVVVGMSKEGEGGVMLHVFEWTHQHLPNYVDCRPIFVRRALEAAGFSIVSAETKSMWVPVEIVLAVKTKPASGG
jgi:demethylmenaquinone methyltransferase/2-methoxy-6-polyprenyl-1,4-benzoquinol methylase